MLFVTLQDPSGNLEMLVFPKTYEQTKHQWQEGVVATIVGKTPREEGENKVFAEKAYHLTPDNVQTVARQISLGSSGKTYTSKRETPISERSITLYLTKDFLQAHGQDLRQLMTMNPGSTDVYIQIGARTIKTEGGLSWNDEVQMQLERLVGASAISVK